MSRLLAYCMPSPKLSDAEEEMSFYLRHSTSLQHQRVPPSPASPTRMRLGSQTVPHRRQVQTSNKFLHTPQDRSPVRTPTSANSLVNSRTSNSPLPQHHSHTEPESENELHTSEISPTKLARQSPIVTDNRINGYVDKVDSLGNYIHHEFDLKRSNDFDSSPVGGHANSPMRPRLRSSNTMDVDIAGRKSAARLRYLPPISRRSDTSREPDLWDASMAGVPPPVPRRAVTKSVPVRLSGCRSMSPTHQSLQTGTTPECLSESVLTILQRIEQHLSVPTPLELWASRQFQREEAAERRRYLKQQLYQCVDKVDVQERVVNATRQWPDDIELIVEVLLDCVTAPTATERPQWLTMST